MGQPRHPRIKPLTVSSLLKPPAPEAYTVDLGMSLMEALKRMHEQALGALLVVDNARLVGVFSPRNLNHKSLHAADFTLTQPLSQFIDTRLLSAAPELEAQACLALMRAEQLDFIPVVAHDKVLGLLSLIELQSAIITQYENIFKAAELDQRIMFLQGTYSC